MLIDGPASPCVENPHVDARADGRAVRADANELDHEPVVAEAGILVEHVVELVARERPAHLLEQVRVTVIVEIEKSDTVAFLKMAKPTRGRDVIETLATAVPIHHVRHEREVGWITRSEIEVQIAVAI